jgi:hypothetical protein
VANTSSPFGFLPSRRIDGAPWTGNQTAYPILSTNTTQIFKGDAVELLPTGYINQFVKGDGATTTVNFCGVFVGCKYVSTSQGRTLWSPYWPGSDATSGTVEAYVIDDPNVVYLAQVLLGAITFASVGQNVDIGASPVGTTATGLSGMTADSTPAQTATLPWKIVGVRTSPPGVNGTDTTTNYNQIFVTPNLSLWRSLSGI